MRSFQSITTIFIIMVNLFLPWWAYIQKQNKNQQILIFKICVMLFQLIRMTWVHWRPKCLFSGNLRDVNVRRKTDKTPWKTFSFESEIYQCIFENLKTAVQKIKYRLDRYCTVIFDEISLSASFNKLAHNGHQYLTSVALNDIIKKVIEAV